MSSFAIKQNGGKQHKQRVEHVYVMYVYVHKATNNALKFLYD